MILSDALILPVSQFQTQQQVMASQIRSHIEYLIQTYSCAHFVVEIDERF